MTKIIFLDKIPKDVKILNQKNSKIFALNFEVEKYLRNKNIIPTDVSEWINWEDFMLIDTIAMDIPMKWGLMKNIDEEIEFKGINLSLLIEKELFLSLLPIIHKIILVDKIIEKKLSVRQTEAFVKIFKNKKHKNQISKDSCN